MKVPFLDLKSHHAPIRKEMSAVIEQVIDASAFAGGSFVADFEKDFAAYCSTKSAIGMGNGTDALWLALLALGVGQGDEVITAPSTFMATAEAITYCGATPVFVDVDERTYTIDPKLIEKAITPKTKAIIPVHLFGQTADMDPIMALAAKHKLAVVEDACQAHGALYKGKKAGSIGAVGCFSFYPGKNLGAIGEGGAAVTSDAVLESKMKVFRDHGQSKKYYHSVIGWNARMDGIQGAVLKIKLARLEAANEGRRKHAEHYHKLLGGTPGIIIPQTLPENVHVHHIYAVRVKERDTVLQLMGERGISCAIHYPVPIHLQEAYAFLGKGRGSFPIAEQCADEFLSLPMYPELTSEMVEAVAKELKAVVAERRAKA